LVNFQTLTPAAPKEPETGPGAEKASIFKENMVFLLVSVELTPPTNWGAVPILLPPVVDFKKILKVFTKR
jgi:hypothetical protein